MRRNCITLREALASDRLDVFVRQEEALGVELTNGSDLERALALLITQRRIQDRSSPTLPRERSAASNASGCIPEETVYFVNCV